ncbi:MAG: collagen binding domain-containing protein [Oscillospiraceae bacterium]
MAAPCGKLPALFHGRRRLRPANATGKTARRWRRDLRLVHPGGRQSAASDVWGRLPFSCLAPGSYTLLELRAPAGYRPDTSGHMVSVDVRGCATIDGEPGEGYTLYNQPLSRLVFLKRDEGIGRPVAGAVFQLSNGQGAVSDRYGKVDFGAVPPGLHTLRETAPAEGYLPNPQGYTVSVSAEGEIRIDGAALETFSVTNRRMSPANL